MFRADYMIRTEAERLVLFFFLFFKIDLIIAPTNKILIQKMFIFGIDVCSKLT